MGLCFFLSARVSPPDEKPENAERSARRGKITAAKDIQARRRRLRIAYRPLNAKEYAKRRPETRIIDLIDPVSSFATIAEGYSLVMVGAFWVRRGVLRYRRDPATHPSPSAGVPPPQDRCVEGLWCSIDRVFPSHGRCDLHPQVRARRHRGRHGSGPRAQLRRRRRDGGLDGVILDYKACVAAMACGRRIRHRRDSMSSRASPPARLRSHTKDILIPSTTEKNTVNYWDSSFRSPVSSPFM